jgi:hypothetical protein
MRPITLRALKSRAMSGWLRRIALNAQVRAGLSGDAVVWAMVAATASTLALIFLLIAAHVWLSQQYGSLIAGLVLGIFFLLVALIASGTCVVLRRRNIERARLELELRQKANENLLDPQLMAVGYQVGEAIGWRRAASLVVIGLFAAGLAKEWLSRRPEKADRDERASADD